MSGVVLKRWRKSRLYVLEGTTVTMEAAAAYGLIRDSLGRVGCDWVAHGHSSNDIGESFNSPGGASCDFVDHVACDDSRRFKTSVGVGSELNDSNRFGAQDCSTIRDGE